MAAEMDEEAQKVIDQSTRLLSYLASVAREVGPEPARDITKQSFVLWADEVPDHPAVFVGPSESRSAWLTVRKLHNPSSPELPGKLKDVVDLESVADPTGQPHLDISSVHSTAVSCAEERLSAWESEARDRHAIEKGVERQEERELNDYVEHFVTRKKDAFVKDWEGSIRAELEAWTTEVWNKWAREVTPTFRARRLYEKLYRLRLEAENQKATLEVLWGNCLMAYAPAGSRAINAPLVVTRLAISLDNVGAISLVPETETELDFSPVEGAEVLGIDRLHELKRETQQGDLDVWNESDQETLRQRLAAPLGVDAQVSQEPGRLTPRNFPVIGAGWAIFTRPRPKREEAFYQALGKKIEREQVVPDALASVVSDKDSVDHALNQLGRPVGGDDGTADRTLMPLPVNEDQERIARQLSTSRGVTVQGPPGTGKSHTIVNLLSHLVAQGKRVLITAQNEQALSVVREKIPTGLRDLSIAVLGSTPAAIEELRQSAQTMRDSLSQVDVIREKRGIEELGERIDELREEARLADRRLVEALRSEESEYELPSGPSKAYEVAQWLSGRKSHDLIPDQLQKDQEFPLAESEYREFIKLSRDISPSDAAAASLDLPELDGLWTPDEFRARLDEMEELSVQVERLAGEGLKPSAVPDFGLEELNSLKTSLVDVIELLEEINQLGWSSIVDALRAGGPSSQLIFERNEQFNTMLESLEERAGMLLGQEIEVPREDPSSILLLLRSWKERLENGRKLPKFGSKQLRELAPRVKVSGYQPSTAEQVGLVIASVERRQQQGHLYRFVSTLLESKKVEIPKVGARFELEMRALNTAIAKARLWWLERYPALSKELQQIVDFKDPAGTKTALEASLQLVDSVIQLKRIEVIEREFSDLAEDIRTQRSDLSSSPLKRELLRAIELRNVTDWEAAVSEVSRLLQMRQLVDRRISLKDALVTAGASRWAEWIIESGGSIESTGDAEDVKTVWEVGQARTWLERIHSSGEVESLMEHAHNVGEELRNVIGEYASRAARLGLKQNMRDSQRKALETWLAAIRKVGKGTGKNAHKFQAQAREALPGAMGAVPVWIMPIYRVLENFDPSESEMFDVVIVDESSQCDLLSLGVLALGQKSVVVGDDKQTSPAAVGIDTRRIFDLQRQHIADLPDKSLLTMDESLYSISARAFPSTILLREHFRCVPEIIRFSNRFYGGKIFPLREVSVPQIGLPVQAVCVEDGASVKQKSHRVNLKEAARLVEKVVECSKNPAYDGLTFGVVTMMSGPQADHIRGMLVDRLGVDEFEKRDLRVGNPPVFQGDERNVIFVSFVADDGSHAATRDRDAQWANVAASRAKDQLWLVYSMDPSLLNPDDYRRAMLEYAQGIEHVDEQADLFDLTESKFEADVLIAMLGQGLDVEPQHRVGNYRIDFVVNVSEGERLAVECDGDSFHGPAQWEQDVRRQRVLERLGWSFWRIRASEYYFDPEKALEPLWDRVESVRARGSQKRYIGALRDEKKRERRRKKEYAEVRERNEEEKEGEGNEYATARVKSPRYSRQESGVEADEAGSLSQLVEYPEEEQAQQDFSLERGITGRGLDPFVAERHTERQTPILGSETLRQVAIYKENPSEAALEATWNEGHRYILTETGKVRVDGDEGGPLDLIERETMAEIAQAVFDVRPAGGRFRISVETGLMVTLTSESLSYIGHFNLER